MRLRLTAWSVALFLASSFSVLADSMAYGSVVTIKKVELKNLKGEWVTIIEPDRRFDPTQEELGVTLVNNGRIPADPYANFRITLSQFEDRQRKTDEAQITLKSDLEPALRVMPHSFIGVWFHLNWGGDIASSGIRDAAITVDDATQTLQGDKFNFLESSGLIK